MTNKQQNITVRQQPKPNGDRNGVSDPNKMLPIVNEGPNADTDSRG